MPASSSTFMSITNAVLGSMNEPEITSGQWLLVTGRQKQVKSLVIEQYGEMVNKLPDYFLHKTDVVRLYKPFTSGKVTEIEETVVTFTSETGDHFDNDQPPDWTPTKRALFRMSLDSDWYVVDQMASGAIVLQDRHLDYPTGSALSASEGYDSDGYSHQIVMMYNSLPSDFQDMWDLEKPFEGYNMKPESVSGLLRRMRQSGDVAGSGPPRHYAVAHDAMVGTGANDGPWLLVHPQVSEDKYVTVHYRRTTTLLDMDSAAAAVIDMPEDHVARLANRCKALAQIQFKKNVELYQVFTSKEREMESDANAKLVSAQRNRLVPNNENYRGFYRGAANANAAQRLYKRRG
ncbi:MAG: hypothetical protein GY838_13655 [bacterium]|nr:hypothetical protein [bacterium]